MPVPVSIGIPAQPSLTKGFGWNPNNVIRGRQKNLPFEASGNRMSDPLYQSTVLHFTRMSFV
jgi:hypothetical protein